MNLGNKKRASSTLLLDGSKKIDNEHNIDESTMFQGSILPLIFLKMHVPYQKLATYTERNKTDLTMFLARKYSSLNGVFSIAFLLKIIRGSICKGVYSFKAIVATLRNLMNASFSQLFGCWAWQGTIPPL